MLGPLFCFVHKKKKKSMNKCFGITSRKLGHRTPPTRSLNMVYIYVHQRRWKPLMVVPNLKVSNVGDLIGEMQIHGFTSLRNVYKRIACYYYSKPQHIASTKILQTT